MKIVVQRTNKRELKICPQVDGSVIVVAYHFLSRKAIAEHIAENIQWITSCIKKISINQANSVNTQNCVKATAGPDQHFDNLDSHTIKQLFAGKCLLLCGQLYQCSASANTQTYLQDDRLYIAEKQFAVKDLRLKAIKSFVKRMSANTLSQEISKLGSAMSLCPTKIQFKDLHGKWCSCSDAALRAIILDYRLIQLPQHLQNYVISHAFAHFEHQGHTNEFFQHLSRFQPNYKNNQNAITNYNFLLDI